MSKRCVNKIKVMRIIARLNIGGPAIHTVILNEGLAKKGFETYLLTGKSDEREGDMAYLAQEKGVKITVIPELGRSIKLWSDIIALWKLFKIMKKEKPHIVHTHTAKAGVLGRCAAIMSGVPIKIHSFHGHIFHSYFGHFKTKIFIMIEKLFANFADRIIVVSEIIKEEISTRFRIADKRKISVMNLGLDLKQFKDVNQRKGELRKELNIGNGVLVAGIVGRLTPIKNHKLLFDAIRLLKSEVPNFNVRFLVVGDGISRDALKAYVEELGIKDWVHFVGWQADMPKIYADLDLVVLTSLNEGTPLSIIEAMAAGRAVVATAVGGVPNLVEDKKTGMLVNSNEPAQLKDAIKELLQNEELCRTLVAAASARVYEKYSEEQLVHNMENLYRELLVKKHIIAINKEMER